MALFKILRGSKENFEGTPEKESVVKKVTDGYAYFVPETGKFYIDVIMPEDYTGEDIDAIVGSNTNQYVNGKRVNRVCINDTI